jgi:tryptophan synthase alpha chain
VTGVTGGETVVDDELRAFLARARRHIAAPLVVGFGVRTAEQAARIGALADGVVMASQFVRLIEDAPSPAAAEAALDRLAGEVRAALSGVSVAAGG